MAIKSNHFKLAQVREVKFILFLLGEEFLAVDSSLEVARLSLFKLELE